MIEQNARQTKVIKSFEGRALTTAGAEQVAREDVDVVRLVYDKQSVAGIREFLTTLAGQTTVHGRSPVMLDISSWIQGLAKVKQAREVSHAETIVVVPVGTKLEGALEVETEIWAKLWTANAKVFFGSGQVCAKVKSMADKKIELEVTQGGTIFPDAEIFIPETRKDQDRAPPALADLKPLVDAGVDYLVIPGAWSSDRISEFRSQIVQAYGDISPWLIAKVDSDSVVTRLEDFLELVEGVLISRRELALSTNPATVPMITKEIIQLCNDHAKVAVTASEMLASMRRNVTPTRAEVSDIANAVLDGTDAVVLSEEVANGKYGLQAVQVTQRIILDIEGARKVKPNWIKSVPTVANEMDATCYNAYKTAERIKAKAIVCITRGGNTALKLASFRAPIPVIGVTFSPAVVRRLRLVRGVSALLLNIDPNIDEVLPLVNDHLARESWLKPGDSIIFVSVTLSSVGRESSNLFSVQRII